MSPQQILLIVWLRKWLVLAVLAVVTAIGTAITLQLPKQYTATTSILLDIKSDPILGALAPGMASPAYMATQTEIIQSDRVGTKVVKILGLDRSPVAIQRWKEESGGKLTIEQYFAELLQRGLVVATARNSNIINITFGAQDPKFAAAVANAYAQAYVDTVIELRVEPARQFAVWFDERTKTLRAELEKAQAKLSAYQQEKGIVTSDEKLDQEASRLNALMGELAAAQAQRADVSSRQRNAGTETSPDVQQSGAVQSLKSELAKAEVKLAEISGTVGANHPQRQALETQITGLKKQLADEMRRVSGTAATATRITAEKEGELKAMIEAQKKRLLALRAQRDEISVLVKEVETAQRAYEAVAQRTTQLTLESQTDQANVRVLSPATEPNTPSKPRVLINILMSVAAGGGLGVALAMALEFLNRRVRTAEDLVLEGVPVIGVLVPENAKSSFLKRLALGRATTRRMLPAPGASR